MPKLLKLAIMSALTLLVVPFAAVIGTSNAYASVGSCSGGYSGDSLRATRYGQLSNGELAASWCATSVSNVTRWDTYYRKTGGSCVTVRLGWETLNSTGTVKGTWWDAGSFTACSGNTYSFARTYSSTVTVNTCVRGILTSGGTKFITKQHCYNQG